MIGGGQVGFGFIVSAIPLWLVTGWLILQWDMKNYEQKNMKKEKKVARFLGWFNVAAGILSFVANWMLRLWG
ncbi:hypothetical protein PAE9249_01994 [Paenibacillus sp. CECT 9249]|uniref:CLC_0170 family protein n=1 Tax=Paenibacillus sp. CECT 9249 TaxID=2845385 RepID=UPI001E2CAB6D|nr:CLC_0170 family protein [Paenibacillus sp. CECT 9249]CAH0119490.1 hypothetical protein PAE9249_01994 [Paenibacillus sp. CECT 9249]